jgi:uncharacterized protein with ATP-grasp and redox domains
MLEATYLCARCLVDQATHAVELSIQDRSERLSVMKGVMEILHHEFPEKIPADLGTRIHQYVKGRAGKDPYDALKRKSNEAALVLAEKMGKEESGLQQLVRAAVAGNAIDFGVDGSRDALHTLQGELQKGFALDHSERFEREVEKAGKILYLTDNCGEVVFDHLLIQYLVRLGKEVTVSPKEEPILNDATVRDLLSLGMDRTATIVPHAKASIGLELSETSEEFRQVWDHSDFVIAKGMGHFEKLYGMDKNIAFLLKAKCLPVAQRLGVDLGSHVLTF